MWVVQNPYCNTFALLLLQPRMQFTSSFTKPSDSSGCCLYIPGIRAKAPRLRNGKLNTINGTLSLSMWTYDVYWEPLVFSGAE